MFQALADKYQWTPETVANLTARQIVMYLVEGRTVECATWEDAVAVARGKR